LFWWKTTCACRSKWDQNIDTSKLPKSFIFLSCNYTLTKITISEVKNKSTRRHGYKQAFAAIWYFWDAIRIHIKLNCSWCSILSNIQFQSAPQASSSKVCRVLIRSFLTLSCCLCSCTPLPGELIRNPMLWAISLWAALASVLGLVQGGFRSLSAKTTT
jgi:hypothetical protein